MTIPTDPKRIAKGQWWMRAWTATRGCQPDRHVIRLSGHAVNVLCGYNHARPRDIVLDGVGWEPIALSAQERAEIERRHQ
jgi:hypothetical protein